MGLIDVLTQYDTKKKAAHAAKTVKHGVSKRREEGKERGGGEEGLLSAVSKNIQFVPESVLMSDHEIYDALETMLMTFFCSLLSLSLSLSLLFPSLPSLSLPPFLSLC